MISKNNFNKKFDKFFRLYIVPKTESSKSLGKFKFPKFDSTKFDYNWEENDSEELDEVTELDHQKRNSQ